MLCPLQRPRRDRAQERHGLHGQRRRYRRNLLRLLHDLPRRHGNPCLYGRLLRPRRNRLFALRRHGPRRGRRIGGRSAQRRVLGGDARRRLGDAARQQGFRKSRSERFRSGNRRDERRDRRFDDGPTRAGRLHVRYVSGTSRPDRRPLPGASPTSIYKFTPAGKSDRGEPFSETIGRFPFKSHARPEKRNIPRISA